MPLRQLQSELLWLSSLCVPQVVRALHSRPKPVTLSRSKKDMHFVKGQGRIFLRVSNAFVPLAACHCVPGLTHVVQKKQWCNNNDSTARPSLRLRLWRALVLTPDDCIWTDWHISYTWDNPRRSTMHSVYLYNFRGRVPDCSTRMCTPCFADRITTIPISLLWQRQRTFNFLLISVPRTTAVRLHIHCISNKNTVSLIA